MWEPFCARNAESAAGRGGPGGIPEGIDPAIIAQFGGRGGAPPTPAVTKIFQLIGVPLPGGGGRGAGGFGFGGARNATTGDYLVILQIGGTTMKQKLHIENTGAAEISSPFGPASGDDSDRGQRVQKRVK